MNCTRLECKDKNRSTEAAGTAGLNCTRLECKVDRDQDRGYNIRSRLNCTRLECKEEFSNPEGRKKLLLELYQIGM